MALASSHAAVSVSLQSKSTLLKHMKANICVLEVLCFCGMVCGWGAPLDLIFGC
jgi:hypothetical protein